jgi:hypothetical protein
MYIQIPSIGSVMSSGARKVLKFGVGQLLEIADGNSISRLVLRYDIIATGPHKTKGSTVWVGGSISDGL